MVKHIVVYAFELSMYAIELVLVRHPFMAICGCHGMRVKDVRDRVIVVRDRGNQCTQLS